MTIRDFLKEVLRNGDDMFIQTEVKLDEDSLIKKITDIVVLLDGKKIEYEAKKIGDEVVVTWK